LKINIVKDLLTSKHSMTQKLALWTSSKHNITLAQMTLNLSAKTIFMPPSSSFVKNSCHILVLVLLKYRVLTC
jgi:hypothetical protein